MAVGLTAAHSPGFVNPAVRCLVKMPGCGYLTVFDNSTFTDNGKNTLKTEQNCRTVPVCNVGMGQTAVPCTCEPFFLKIFSPVVAVVCELK